MEPLRVEHEKHSDNLIDDSEIEGRFDDSSDVGYQRKSAPNSDSDAKQSYLEGAFATSITLFDHLSEQLHLLNLSTNEIEIGETIISSLDLDGYFKADVKDLAEYLNTDEKSVLKLLKMIQSFEPPGIAARDLAETLLIQIEQQVDAPEIAKEIIRNYLSYLELKKYKEIAQKLSVTTEDVRKAAKYIANLEPYPARSFDINSVKFVIPDVKVEKTDDGFIIIINDDFIPKLNLNTKYRNLIDKDKLENDAKKFLDEKYSEAKLLLFGIKKRRSTVLEVVEKIVDIQKDFFEKGPRYLHPLTLKDVAEKINMHESTVSRVTSDKYVETPWGIYELKYFFSSGIRKTTGEYKSSRSIKEIIKQIIENESNDKTLSDQKIVDILSNQGIKIARRTVAKYRKSLKILPSYSRKDK